MVERVSRNKPPQSCCQCRGDSPLVLPGDVSIYVGLYRIENEEETYAPPSRPRGHESPSQNVSWILVNYINIQISMSII